MATVVSTPLRAARAAIVTSTLVATVVHAWAVSAVATPVLPSLTAVGIGVGLAGGWRAPFATVAALLAVAPVWQVLVGLATGSHDIHFLMPWLAALATCLAVAQPTSWRCAAGWVGPVTGWGLVLALTWPVTVAREFDFAGQAVAAGGDGGGSARQIAATVALAGASQMVALLLFDWLHGRTNDERRRLWRASAPGIAAVCTLAVVQAAVPTLLSREPWITLARSPGGFYDANAMGALAALFGPVLAAGLAHAPFPGRPWVATGWLALSLSAVLASGSRTAAAAWLITAPIALVDMRGRWLRAGLAAGVMATLVGVAVVRGPATSGPLASIARLADTLGRAAADGPAAIGAVWARDGYGPAAMAIIREHPLVGVGPGTFGVVVTDYGLATVGVALPPDNAQNWWRQQWAELGGLGALPAFACAWLVGLTAWTGRRSGWTWSMPLVALGAMSLVSPPVQHPLVQVQVALLLGTAVTAISERTPHPAHAVRRGVGTAAWLLAIACAVGLWLAGMTTFRPPIRAARFGHLYHYGFSDEVATPLGPARWAATRAVGVFPTDGRPLRLVVTVPHDDLERAPVRVTVTDRAGAACTWEVADDAPRECVVAARPGEWQYVRLAVSRPWLGRGREERAALVRLVPIP